MMTKAQQQAINQHQDAREFNVDGWIIERGSETTVKEAVHEFMKNGFDHNIGNRLDLWIKPNVKKPNLKSFNQCDTYEYKTFGDLRAKLKIFRDKGKKGNTKKNLNEGLDALLFWLDPTTKELLPCEVQIKVGDFCYYMKGFDLIQTKCSHYYYNNEWVKNENYKGTYVDGWEITWYYPVEANYDKVMRETLKELIILEDFEIYVNGKLRTIKRNFSYRIPDLDYDDLDQDSYWKDQRESYRYSFQYDPRITKNTIWVYWANNNETMLVPICEITKEGFKGILVIDSLNLISSGNVHRNTLDNDFNNEINNKLDALKDDYEREIEKNQHIKKLMRSIDECMDFQIKYFVEVLGADQSKINQYYDLEDYEDRDLLVQNMNQFTDLIRDIFPIVQDSEILKKKSAKFTLKNGGFYKSIFTDKDHEYKSVYRLGSWSLHSDLREFAQKILNVGIDPLIFDSCESFFKVEGRSLIRMSVKEVKEHDNIIMGLSSRHSIGLGRLSKMYHANDKTVFSATMDYLIALIPRKSYELAKLKENMFDEPIEKEDKKKSTKKKKEEAPEVEGDEEIENPEDKEEKEDSEEEKEDSEEKEEEEEESEEEDPKGKLINDIEKIWEVDPKGNIVPKEIEEEEENDPITEVPKGNGKEKGDGKGKGKKGKGKPEPPQKGVQGTDADDFADISVDGNGKSLIDSHIKLAEHEDGKPIEEVIEDFWEDHGEPTEKQEFYQAGVVMDSKAFGGKGGKINFLFNSKEDKEKYQSTQSLKSIGIPQKTRVNYKTFAMWIESVKGCLEVLPSNTKIVPFFYYDPKADSEAFIASNMTFIALNLHCIDEWEASFGKLKANHLVQYIQKASIHEVAHYFEGEHNDNFIAGEGMVSKAVFKTDLFDRLRKIFNAKNLRETLEGLKPHVNEVRPKEISFVKNESGTNKHYVICPKCNKMILMTDAQSKQFTYSAEMIRDNPIGIMVIGVKCECGEEF